MQLRWIQDLQQGTLFGTLLDKVYEPERIREAVDQLVDQAAETVEAARFNTASQRVAELTAKFGKQKDALVWLARGLALARPWLLGLQPWGPLALTTTYVAAIGYTVYLGGDYVDWLRTGSSERLNFVPGLRSVVQQAVSGAA